MPGRDVENLTRMRGFAATLPTALLEGYRSGREIALSNGAGVARVYVAGMGASGVAADLVRGVVEAETSVALTVVRGPTLPRSADASSRSIFVSYSGETWETLRAYESAARWGSSRVVVTSGGTLAERAEADGVGVVRIPPGIPPRSAVGYLLGGVLGLLDLTFPESNEGRLGRIADAVGELVRRCSRPRGPAGLLATALGDRLPFVYAESSFLALARRWKTQIEENAKRVAVFDEVPESFHNSIVGWDAIRRSEATHYAVVLLEWSEEDPLVRRSFRYLERLLGAKGVKVVRAALPPTDRLEAVLGGVALGDLTSLCLAERRKVDPLPVEAITRLKTALATLHPAPA